MVITTTPSVEGCLLMATASGTAVTLEPLR